MFRLYQSCPYYSGTNACMETCARMSTRLRIQRRGTLLTSRRSQVLLLAAIVEILGISEKWTVPLLRTQNLLSNLPGLLRL